MRSSHGALFRLAVVCLVVLPAGVRPAEADAVPLAPRLAAEVDFVLREEQPDIPHAGRVNAIAIRPGFADHLLVGTESGGLFRSTDGGAHWFHVDSFGPWAVMDVAYVPGSSQRVLATASRGFGSDRSGGIWRSTDNGLTWVRPATASPPPGSGCPLDAAAFRLSFEPGTARVYATTECGVAVSDDHGVSWRHSALGRPIPGDSPVAAVQALGDGRAVAAGQAGVFRTTDGGFTWRAARRRPPNAIVSYRALSGSPVSRDDVYVVDSRGHLHWSTDAGNTWWRLPAVGIAVGEGCGGFEFIQVVWSQFLLDDPANPTDARGLDLYLSNRCQVFRTVARRSVARPRPLHPATWHPLHIDHADMRALAFDDQHRPRFLGTDGGFHATDDQGTTWRLTGGSRGGLGALQIYEVTGQRIETPRRYDLYIGTQDNNLWSSRSRPTWPFVRGAEGFAISVEPRVARAEDSFVNFKAGAPFDSRLSRANFQFEEDWPDAQVNYSDPVLLARSKHVQQTGPLVGDPRPFGFSYTADHGATWGVAVSDVGAETTQLPKVSRYGRDDAEVYQTWREGVDSAGNHVFKLARISGLAHAVGRVTFPAHAGFGGLGLHPAQFVWEPVWAVDPQDPMHLIAPDAIEGAMKRSLDGGMTWTRMDALTRLVTGDGARPFTLDFGSLPFPIVTAIGFYPEDPNLVLVGTWEAGLFLSVDRGETWRAVPTSERLPRATRFHWANGSTVFISSWGRGLWRLTLSIRYLPDLLTTLCGNCEAYDLGGNLVSEPVFDRAVVVHDGGLSEASAQDGQLLSFSVTPGSLGVLFSALKGDTLGELAERSEPGEFEGVDVAKQLAASGQVVRGLALAGGKIAAVIASKEETTIEPPGAFNEFKEEGEPFPPSLAGRPYIHVRTGLAATGIPLLDESGRVQVSGRNFVPDPRRKVRILIDDRPLRVTGPRVDKDGAFEIRLNLRKLRLAAGRHTIAAVQRLGQQTLVDTTFFGVPTSDFAEAPQQDPVDAPLP